MNVQAVLPLYLFACWHVMMPGHGKTLLLAVCLAGKRRTRLLPLALGYGLSHGLLMGVAAVAGMMLADQLAAWISQYGVWIKNIYLPLLLFFGLYFCWKMSKPQDASETQRALDCAREPMVDRHPLLMGLGIGFIPCSDVLGLAVISPMLIKTGHNLLAAGSVVWFGVVSTIVLIATAFYLLPVERLTRKMPENIAYAAAAVICFSVFIWRCYALWCDYVSLSGSF